MRRFVSARKEVTVRPLRM